MNLLRRLYLSLEGDALACLAVGFLVGAVFTLLILL